MVWSDGQVLYTADLLFGQRYYYIASATLKQSNDTETVSGEIYDLCKVIKMIISDVTASTLRISFDMKSSINGETSFAKIKYNKLDGVDSLVVGSEQTTTSSTYSTKTQDIGSLNSGVIELWAKGSSTTNVWVRNLRIYGTGTLEGQTEFINTKTVRTL